MICTVFGTEGSDIVVFQQRSPVLKVLSLRLLLSSTKLAFHPKSRKQDYVDGLIAFLKQSRCGAAIFLSGMDLTNRTDAQMLWVYPTLTELPGSSTFVAPLPTSIDLSPVLLWRRHRSKL